MNSSFRVQQGAWTTLLGWTTELVVPSIFSNSGDRGQDPESCFFHLSASGSHCMVALTPERKPMWNSKTTSNLDPVFFHHSLNHVNITFLILIAALWDRVAVRFINVNIAISQLPHTDYLSHRLVVTHFKSLDSFSQQSSVSLDRLLHPPTQLLGT